MLLATQRKIPASTRLTPVTWRTPFGRRVYLDGQVRGQKLCDMVKQSDEITTPSGGCFINVAWPGLPDSNPRINDSCILTRVAATLYLLSVVFRDTRFLSQLMLASGIPLIWHWKRATPPSSTRMDAGWVWNLGRAEEQREFSHLGMMKQRKAANFPNSTNPVETCWELQNHQKLRGNF